jgi:hypothetical protein
MKRVLNAVLLSTLVFFTANHAFAQDFLETQVVVPELNLNSPVGGQVDEFGRSVAIDGNYMVAGTPFSDFSGNASGSVTVYEKTGGAWAEMAILQASDALDGDFFGRNVRISGTTIMVGSIGHNVGNATSAGAVYIYELTAGVWLEKPTLIAPDGESYDYFGHSLDIDGDRAVVGSIDDDDQGFSSGSIYIFERIAGDWTQVAKRTTADGAFYDYFGWSVAISGTEIAAASYYDDPSGSNSGSVYVFSENGGAWTETQKLTASDGAANDHFGFSVSMSGTRIAVGARNEDDAASNAGAVYVYESVGGIWSQTDKLTASDAGVSHSFGYDVAIDGTRLAVGSYREGSVAAAAGAVYVYDLAAGTWSETQKITAADGAAGDEFGFTVSLSGSGMAIGAHLDDDFGVNSGSVYLYENSGTWTQETKLISNDLIDDPSQDLLGIDVAIAGDWAMIGAYGDDDFGNYSGSVHVYQRVNNVWTYSTKIFASDAVAEDNFGFNVAMSGDLAIVGAYGDDDSGALSGSVYVFQNQNGTWTEIQKLIASDGAAFDDFGFSVAIDGNHAVIGSYLDDDGASASGSVYFYEFDGTQFQPRGKVSALDPVTNQHFGYSVDVSGTTAVIGARFDDDNGNFSGSAYIYDFGGGNWSFNSKITPNDGSGFRYFGTSVSINGDNILVGAIGDATIASSAGAVYRFENAGGTWTQADKFVDPNGSSFAYLGTSCDMGDGIALAGAYRGIGNVDVSGNVLQFADSSGTWIATELMASDGQSNDYFGGSVQIDGRNILIGAQHNDDMGFNSGSAYFYEECVDFDNDGACDFQQVTVTNDDCAGAISVTKSEWGPAVWTTGSLFGASGSTQACIGDADDDLWYTFTANSENDIIHAWDVTGENNMAIEVFDACAGTSIGCFDNYPTGAPERALVGGLVVGADYYYRIYDVGTGAQATQDILTQVKTFAEGGIRDVYCGVLDYEFDDQIQAERDDLGELYASPAAPVTGYGFKFEEPISGFTSTLDNPTTDGFYTQLSQIPGLEYSTIYDASARHSVTVQANGILGVTIWSDYGPSCQIGLANLLPETNVQTSYCAGESDYYLQDNIQCVPVSGATQYRFTFDDGSSTHTGVSSNYNLVLSNVSGLQYGTSYSITVEAFVNGLWSDPGSPCTIFTAVKPENTQLVASECGLSYDYTSSENILCDIVLGSTMYQWRFTDTAGPDVHVFTTGNYSLLLAASQNSGLISTTYNVAVRAFAGGVWGDFSNECPITINNINPIIGPSPDFATKNVSESSMNMAIYPNPASGNQVLLTLSDLSAENGMMRVTIFDETGKEVLAEDVAYSGSVVNHLVDLPSELSNGVYHVRATSTGESYALKLVLID